MRKVENKRSRGAMRGDVCVTEIALSEQKRGKYRGDLLSSPQSNSVELVDEFCKIQRLRCSRNV